MKSRKHICYFCERDISKEIHWEVDWYCYCTKCYGVKDNEKA